MTPTPRGGGRRIYRPVSATIGLIASAAVAALLLVDLFWRGGLEQGLLVAPWVLLALWAVYVLGYAPHIATDAAGIRFHNVLSVVRIPWGQVASLRLRWQVEATLIDGRVLRAYGGPSRSRPKLRPAAAPTSTPPHMPSSGGDADLASLPANIRDISLMQRDLDRAHERGTDAAPLRRTPDVPALIALVVLVVWTLWSVLTVAAG